MLERSTSCQPERGSSKKSEALPVIHDSIKSPVATNSNRKTSRISDLIDGKSGGRVESCYNSSTKASEDTSLNGGLPILTNICNNSSPETELETFKENSSLRASESTDVNEDEASWEEDLPERIYEVRKDSALYIEERNIEGLTIRNNSLAVGAAESRSLRTLGSCNVCENIEESGNSKLSKPRARRESSGYFSNLGTFDEDRWIANTMDLGSQQDLITSRDISRERRRSSTKNRLPLMYNQPQQSVQLPIGPSCGQQSTKIPNLIYPGNHYIEETCQSLSASELSSVVKSLRTEMPDIEEQTSFDLDKPTNCDARDDSDAASTSADVNDDLEGKISQLSIGDVPKIVNDEPSPIDDSRKEIIEDFVQSSTEEANNSTKNVFNIVDEKWKKQNRRTIPHQHSSPTTRDTGFEKIVENPSSETEPTKYFDCSSTLENYTKVEAPQASEVTSDEDDNDEVVTAVLEPLRGRVSAPDSGKALPKPIKVYQLLSTQSEDRGDDDPRIFDRRTSLQITRRNEDETIRQTCQNSTPKEHQRKGALTADEKKLIHADSVPILKILSASDPVEERTECCDPIYGKNSPGASAIFSTSGGPEFCTDKRLSVVEKVSGSTIPAIRPIYPYCPYSPYGSPQGSPRSSRKRPLRESRRVSIDSRQGALQLNQYKLLNNIGQGSYGIVKLAYNEEDDTHYAMKILSKKKLMKKAGIFGRIAPGRKSSSNPLAKVYREIALLKKLDHPNVVKLVEVLDDPDEDNLYLVFELVQKGEVLQIPTDKPLDEEIARRYFRDVVMGVEYLHYQRIVHRDIKPSNLLVDSEGRVKVADLGVSAELRAAGELLSGSAGTPAFAAPETSTPGAEYSGTLCDVWSMGITLYCLVTGKLPWDGSGSIIGVQAAIRSEQLRFPEKPCLSEDLYHLISEMLAKDPTKRINLVDIKEHRWVTNNGKEPLPSETENCRLPVTVTDEEVARVVTRVPKLDTLILIKTMLKQHSFQNPFLPRRTVRTTADTVADVSMKQQRSTDVMDYPKDSAPLIENLVTKTEKYHSAGRSNSAPDRYEWQTNGRQMSSDLLLPPVTESSSQETEMEKR
ncbi:uncharacterized protein [Venturia canescens]|nr:uncharacterized protein LOC122418856 isoform X2 [Venturia canescens]